VTKKKPDTLEDIIPQRVNANAHTPRGMGLLEKSISERGWIGAITAAADGEVFDGSARRETLETAGLDDAIFVRTDGTRPVVLIREDIPTADDPRARELAIEANRIAQLNLAWDASVLAQARDDGIIDDQQFTVVEMGRLLEQAGTEIIETNELWKGMPAFEQENKAAYQSIHVHFKSKEDVEAFSRLINQTLTDRTRAIWYPQAEKIDMVSEHWANEP
jgi:hypothetical protein